ncbi:uncharacterized protein LOC134455685 [Engraulis encrasicolus]|uniref:uncharacterized protein LOC134455685 n=1 Tax=Engraulis encrasicolus TaxID=184585 RepID=UPI002FD5D9A9
MSNTQQAKSQKDNNRTTTKKEKKIMEQTLLEQVAVWLVDYGQRRQELQRKWLAFQEQLNNMAKSIQKLYGTQRMLRRQRRMKIQAARQLRVNRRRRARAQLVHSYCTEVMCLKSVWTYPRSSDWWEHTAMAYNDEQWLNDFRVSRETFDYLCRALRPALQRRNTSFRLAIPLEKRVAIALYKLASTVEYRTVANLFAVGKTTVVTTVHAFCRAVISYLTPKHIKLPSQAKLAEMADYFETRYGIPQCVGAIDGSHIPITKPQQYQSDYCNRKGWHSIILQAVVDGKGMFWDLNVGIPGREHDATVLKKSNIWWWALGSDALSGRVRNICGTDVGYFILGDSAYPLQSWLMKPFPDSGRLTQSQELYNKRTSRARCVVEHAFGRLKGRWRCLGKKNECSVTVVEDMVLACCTLHNLCEQNLDAFLAEWDVPSQLAQPLRVAEEGENADAGAVVRRALEQWFAEQQ